MTYSFVCVYSSDSVDGLVLKDWGENCVPVYSRSVDVSEFSAESAGTLRAPEAAEVLRAAVGASAVTAWPSCSAGAGLHGVSLTTGGLQFSFQLISFVALTFSDLKGIKKRHALTLFYVWFCLSQLIILVKFFFC